MQQLYCDPLASKLTIEETDASDLTSSARSSRRGTEVKLVSNARMKQELIFELTYPTYSEGLNAIFLDPASPWRSKE